MNRRPTFLGLATACFASAALAACAPAPTAGPAPTASPVATPPPSLSALPSPSPSLSTSPSATVLTSAVSATTARGTARLAITVLSTVEGFEDEIQGEGFAVLNAGDADLTWNSVVGQTHEIVLADELFVQLEPPSGAWVPVPAEEWTPTAAAGRPLRGLSDVTDVRLDGVELLDGVESTRYSGFLNLAGHSDGLGLNSRALQLAAASPSARIAATVWIDSSGLIVQVMRTLIGTTDVAASTVTRLTDFGIAAPITAPIEE